MSVDLCLGHPNNGVQDKDVIHTDAGKIFIHGVGDVMKSRRVATHCTIHEKEN